MRFLECRRNTLCVCIEAIRRQTYRCFQRLTGQLAGRPYSMPVHQRQHEQALCSNAPLQQSPRIDCCLYWATLLCRFRVPLQTVRSVQHTRTAKLKLLLFFGRHNHSKRTVIIRTASPMLRLLLWFRCLQVFRVCALCAFQRLRKNFFRTARILTLWSSFRIRANHVTSSATL